MNTNRIIRNKTVKKSKSETERKEMRRRRRVEGNMQTETRPNEVKLKKMIDNPKYLINKFISEHYKVPLMTDCGHG